MTGKCIQCKKGYEGALPGEQEEDKCNDCKRNSNRVAFEIDRKFAAIRAAEGPKRNARADYIQNIIHNTDPNAPIIIKASDIANGNI